MLDKGGFKGAGIRHHCKMTAWNRQKLFVWRADAFVIGFRKAGVCEAIVIAFDHEKGNRKIASERPQISVRKRRVDVEGTGRKKHSAHGSNGSAERQIGRGHHVADAAPGTEPHETVSYTHLRAHETGRNL